MGGGEGGFFFRSSPILDSFSSSGVEAMHFNFGNFN